MMRQQSHRFRNSAAGRNSSPRASERGVALVITLLLLSLLTVLSLGMILAVSSQTLIGGYYRNYRGAFYAADSGANLAVQYMTDRLVSGVPGAYANPPVGCTTTTTTTAGEQCASGADVTLASNVSAAVLSTYGSSTALNTGNAANSWNESFKIQSVSLTPVWPPTPNGAPNPTNGTYSSYTYQYAYTVVSVGSAQGTEQSTVQEEGTINLGIAGQAASTSISFAYFGGFVDQYPACLGALVPGTMTGPMFTNSAWEFMPPVSPWTAPYIFTDPVGQVGADAYYWNASLNQCTASPTTSYGTGANLVAPTFQQGFQLNQPAVTLPPNDFSQEWAVIDGTGCGGPPSACVPGTPPPTPTTAQLSANLENVQGAPYPSTGASRGVFFTTPGTSASNPAGSMDPGCGTVPAPCVQGGGFYVQGDASVTLQPSGATAQVYTITQGGTVTTITIDPAANNGVGTTVITSGSNTQTLNGVPQNYLTTVNNGDAAMIYVNGNITSLSGPGEGQAAIQDNAMITITASGDVTATGDVLYKTEPVTLTQNQIIPGSNPPCCNGTPMDTLIPSAANMNQVLGIFTATGNFTVQSSYADHNIEVDGSIAAISQTASSSSGCNSGSGSMGGFTANGSVNTFNNVGGQIQSCIYYADIDTENIWFDRRFTDRNGFAPAWFPSTTITQGGPLPTNTTPTISRTQWVNTSSTL